MRFLVRWEEMDPNDVEAIADGLWETFEWNRRSLSERGGKSETPKRDSAIGEDSGGADGDDLVIGHVVHKSAR